MSNAAEVDFEKLSLLQVHLVSELLQFEDAYPQSNLNRGFKIPGSFRKERFELIESTTTPLPFQRLLKEEGKEENTTYR